ncbi:MAG: hypothetical protein K6F53_05755 [Lachnospiraceae bacterium]|nr:hypothetical protein [Lachnospiraceae bacterium]
MMRNKDEKKDRTEQMVLLLLMVTVFVISVIRAAVSSMTYDEAFTYCRFVRRIDPSSLRAFFDSLKFAGEEAPTNNHWMNTLLIFGADRIFHTAYNEFVIRFPSLLFFAFYLIAVFKGRRKGFYSGITVLFLIGNYYLGEFYSIARGYGMAQTLVFAACLFYLDWKESEYEKDGSLMLCAAFLALGVTANSIVVFILPSFGIFWLIRLIRKKKLKDFLLRRWWFVLLFFAFVGFFALKQMSDAGDKFAEEKQGNFFSEVIGGMIGMFVKKPLLMWGAAILLVLVTALSIFCLRKKVFERDLFWMFVIFLAVDLFASLILHNEYIAGRFTLPFYGMFVLGFSGLFSMAARSLTESGAKTAESSGKPGKSEKTVRRIFADDRLIPAVGLILLLILGALYLNKLNVHTVSEWNFDENRGEKILTGYLINGEYSDVPKETPSFTDVFYREKAEYLKERYAGLYE